MIKKLIIYCLALGLFLSVKGQQQTETGEFYYKQGLQKAEDGNLAKALELFDKSISLKADEYVAWYNRGIVKFMMHRYEDALVDLEQTIKLNPGYKKAYLNRGSSKRHLTDYGGAILDYTRAIELDSAYAEAYYYRGQVYELFEKLDAACKDFQKAKELGYANAENHTNVCQPSTRHGELHPVLWLTKTSGSRMYGFSDKDPIKVGNAPDGGPANERAYLELLRDAKGNPVQYEKIGSCCGYKSDNAPKGMALLDKYQMSFLNDAGEQRTVYVYLSFYDYEEPQILYGFTTVKRIQTSVY
jgi:tetratricopeptide (TPR) repeat protein